MQISNLRIKGFKSFGPEGVDILLKNKLSAFIGLNSSGKTTALEALRKLFGSTLSERELVREDFHIGKEENSENIVNRELSIEAKIQFSEEESESDAIVQFFPDMVINGQGQDPYVRIRLEAKWKKSDIEPDGEFEFETYFIKVADGEIANEDNKTKLSPHLRQLIQILYVPAIRRPSEQIKYASGSILYRILRKIQWDDSFKVDFDEKIHEINEAFKGLAEFNVIQDVIKNVWGQFHKDERYKDTALGFSASSSDEILKKLEISFSPTGTHKEFFIHELGDGYRSMFYLTLVCALLDIEEQLADRSNNETLKATRPLLTILAIEEPENHIAPQLLGRVVKILNTISKQNHSQVLLSSHTPSIVKRIDPESILHFRINESYESQVSMIVLPEENDLAYRYIKQAIHNYPEIYFARLVVIGEGDTEEVIFNRFMEIEGVDFDDNIITFAPLGHRFVNHIWKLLNALQIPFITLLDLDLERNGGGWGRVKYALQQLIKIGKDKNELLALTDGSIFSDERLESMHNMELNERNIEIMYLWIRRLNRYDVYFSEPLDLDFLMLKSYTSFYKDTIPKNGGPQIPNKTSELDKFNVKIANGVQATLKSADATGHTYTPEDRELMIWYNYHFLGRGKPTTHILALAKMTEEEIKQSFPPLFTTLFKRMNDLLIHS
ncbi:MULTISPECIES: ATP-dependent nuclease [unclassified Psychrobacter]|uniref:ATP-dependent nuclease n=1 Tax=unclassified Psychrobacter TaxID=196806 RepID=UPI003FCF1DE4